PAGVQVSLAGRTALVTGGGSGLGRATALRLARCGAHVVVADVDGEAAAKVAAECESQGTPLTLDVSSSGAVDAALEELFAEHGAAFDCLVNNAGTDRGAGILELSDEQWRLV